MSIEEGSRGALTWSTRCDASRTVGDRGHGRYNPVVSETGAETGIAG